MSDAGTVRPPAHIDVQAFGREVQHYLSLHPRQLPSRYLYDPLGSLLFEAICWLPWYPITRAERRLIEKYRADILLEAGQPQALLELGSGNGEKLALLLDGPVRPHTVHLVDVSASALDAAERRLAEMPGLRILAHQEQYEEGLKHLSDARRHQRVLVLFLGSNIGNFDPAGARAFLGAVRARLKSGDTFLIGVDLIKPESQLLAAYDDPLGVTAAFNKNLLVRLNEELAANFDLANFAHRAVWNAGESRVEMHLESQIRQAVAVPGANLTFTLDAGERIWTESSYKSDPDEFRRLLRQAGFTPERAWIDEPGQFLLLLSGVT